VSKLTGVLRSLNVAAIFVCAFSIYGVSARADNYHETLCI
jgi:hypothetical protein